MTPPRHTTGPEWRITHAIRATDTWHPRCNSRSLPDTYYIPGGSATIIPSPVIDPVPGRQDFYEDPTLAGNQDSALGRSSPIRATGSGRPRRAPARRLTQQRGFARTATGQRGVRQAPARQELQTLQQRSGQLDKTSSSVNSLPQHGPVR